MSKIGSKRNEYGTSLVEAAIAAPLFLLLIMSILWGALYMRVYLTDGHAAKLAARSGAVAADATDSDFLILQDVKKSLTALSTGSVIRVVIYHASGINATPTATCKQGTPSSSVGSECNVYGPNDLDHADSEFVAGTVSNANYWSAQSRASTRSSGSTYLGVYLLTASGVAGFGLPASDVARYGVVPIEAHSY